MVGKALIPRYFLVKCGLCKRHQSIFQTTLNNSAKSSSACNLASTNGKPSIKTSLNSFGWRNSASSASVVKPPTSWDCSTKVRKSMPRQPAVEAGVEPESETITYTRQKPKRKPLPAHFPRQTIVHDIEDKTCDCCGHDLHRIGEETNEQLEFIPAQVKVIEHVRPKYGCRHCERQGTEVKIRIAPVAPTPIPKSIATASLLAQIITSKYQYALPLYRQEQMFKQFDIDLNRKTLAEWMMKSAHLLEPLYQRLKIRLLEQTVIQADETPVQVIKEDKHRCYMWVYCTGSDSPSHNGPPNIVLYDYQASRSGQCARDYLAGFKGYLQVDGYAGYHQTDATLVGCWAHARRKFVEERRHNRKTSLAERTGRSVISRSCIGSSRRSKTLKPRQSNKYGWEKPNLYSTN